MEEIERVYKPADKKQAERLYQALNESGYGLGVFDDKGRRLICSKTGKVLGLVIGFHESARIEIELRTKEGKALNKLVKDFE